MTSVLSRSDVGAVADTWWPRSPRGSRAFDPVVCWQESGSYGASKMNDCSREMRIGIRPCRPWRGNVLDGGGGCGPAMMI
eukprot:8226838-Pyramimonas_sp.AAC.1